MNRYSLAKRCFAEALGTAWLVLMGVGTAVISGAVPWVGVTGVAIAFGLSLLTAAYTFGSISGCHINPAVTIGFWVAKQFSFRDVLPYIGSQVLGGIWGTTILFLICMGKPEFTTADFGSNGVGIHSPGNYSWWACALAEFIVSCGFVLLILSVTSSPAFKQSAPIPIGLGLTLAHLILIPVTNASVNPVRSLATAIFTRGWALADLWIFIVFPIFTWSFGGYGCPMAARTRHLKQLSVISYQLSEITKRMVGDLNQLSVISYQKSVIAGHWSLVTVYCSLLILLTTLLKRRRIIPTQNHGYMEINNINCHASPHGDILTWLSSDNLLIQQPTRRN